MIEPEPKKRSDLKNGKWNYRSGGSSCKFTYWDRSKSGEIKLFTDKKAKENYYRSK